jgi:hypothetical protein
LIKRKVEILVCSLALMEVLSRSFICSRSIESSSLMEAEDNNPNQIRESN